MLSNLYHVRSDLCIYGSIVHRGLKVVASDDEVFCHSGDEVVRDGGKVVRGGVKDELIGGKVIIASDDELIGGKFTLSQRR